MFHDFSCSSQLSSYYIRNLLDICIAMSVSGESKLSLTANVISIATFVGAVYVSGLFWIGYVGGIDARVNACYWSLREVLGQAKEYKRLRDGKTSVYPVPQAIVNGRR